MEMNKRTLYQTRGLGTTQRITNLIEELDSTYLRVYKRKLPDDMLFISSWGEPKSATLGLTAYYEPGQEDIVTFLQDIATNYEHVQD